MEKKITLESLAKQIKDGELSAFEILYKKTSKKIYHFIYSFVLNKEDAEEIMHDVFLKLWEKRTSINEEKSFQSYIFTIAKNATLDKIRKYSADNVNLKLYFKNSDLQGHINENETVVNNILDQIHILVEEMPFQRRKVFKLNRFEGMSQKNISEYLQISQGTVEKHISQGMKFLKAELKKRCIPTTFLMLMITFA